MRKLETSDAYKVSRLITTSGMRDDLRNIMKGVTASSNVEDVGMDGVFAILGALSGKAEEKQMYEIVGDLIGTDAASVSKMPIMDFVNTLKEIYTENKDFFTMLSVSLLKK